MSKKTIIFTFIFFYLSLILGFFFGEDLNGGAKADFESYSNLFNEFSGDFKSTFLNYASFDERHSPIMVMFISLLLKANLNLEIIRFLNLHINLLSIYFFYKCLKIKFSYVNSNYIILISLIFFISTTFRSLSIWPDSRALGLLFFILSIKFFLEFQETNKFTHILKNIFFLAVSSYFSPNFSIFSIYFFLNYFFILKDFKKILKIIILNIFLSLPAFYYILILDVNFIKLGLTPGSSVNLNINSVEFNFSNKIICISSIIFFYTFPIYIYMKEKFEIDFKNLILALTFILIYLYCIINFNYQTAFSGGGVFFQISNLLFSNNLLLYFITLISFYYLFVQKFNFNNFVLIIILIVSNPQLTIYHKYYDPLILILMFTLFEFKINKKFFNKINVTLIYSVYIFFLVAKIGQNYAHILQL